MRFDLYPQEKMTKRMVLSIFYPSHWFFHVVSQSKNYHLSNPNSKLKLSQTNLSFVPGIVAPNENHVCIKIVFISSFVREGVVPWEILCFARFLLLFFCGTVYISSHTVFFVIFVWYIPNCILSQSDVRDPSYRDTTRSEFQLKHVMIFDNQFGYIRNIWDNAKYDTKSNSKFAQFACKNRSLISIMVFRFNWSSEMTYLNPDRGTRSLPSLLLIRNLTIALSLMTTEQ
jgi:hypothetical protein